MILTGTEIKRNVSLGRITITPFDEKCINPNSYNYHLGNTYIKLDKGIESLNEKGYYELYDIIPEDGLILEPGFVYLCNTAETIGSERYVTSLLGKSSMGRLGLFLQLSADLGHQNEIHQWTLELTATIPTKIYPYMVIGQVTFWKVYGDTFKSKGYYKNFNLPTPSRGEVNDIIRD